VQVHRSNFLRACNAIGADYPRLRDNYLFTKDYLS